MKYGQIYHGLINVSTFESRPPVICWLRLHRLSDASPEYVAVLTEVPGNDGGSISNQHEFIAEHLYEEFGVALDSLALFRVWPAGLFEGPSSWMEVDLDNAPLATDTTRGAVEDLVGERMSELPSHGDLHTQVVQRGGGIVEEIFRPLFEAITLDRLPPPHNPCKCDHVRRFVQLRASIEGQANDGDVADRIAGRQFLESLSAEDRAGCWPHLGDWRIIAESSVEILDRLGPCDPKEYVKAAKRLGLRHKDEGWLISLFSDPVIIGGDGYTNGQHRGCALRFSGAKRAVVQIGDESLGWECTDWTYLGGG